MIVLPAYAGMILQALGGVLDVVRAPRVCGDDPASNTSVSFCGRCSPRMRG